MKSGDIYQLDNGQTIMVVEGREGFQAAIIDTTGVVIVSANIDNSYLHSMRAVAVCNMVDVLEEVECL